MTKLTDTLQFILMLLLLPIILPIAFISIVILGLMGADWERL